MTLGSGDGRLLGTSNWAMQIRDGTLVKVFGPPQHRDENCTRDSFAGELDDGCSPPTCLWECISESRHQGTHLQDSANYSTLYASPSPVNDSDLTEALLIALKEVLLDNCADFRRCEGVKV